MTKLKEEKGWDEARLEEFKKKVQTYFMKSIKPNFKDLDVYTGSSMTPEGMYVYICSSAIGCGVSVANSIMQACLPQLSRRRRHTIFYHLEAWLERGESLDTNV